MPTVFQHLPIFSPQALRRGGVMLAATMLVWLGVAGQARADGADQLSSAGQIWYNASTGIVEDTVTPFGGNAGLPIESVWLYKIGASGYYQGFTPNQTGLTLNIWEVGYIPNMIVVRCSRRQGCSGMLESNNATITPPSCPTISIYPHPLPNALQGVYYGVETITPSGGTAPYSWSVVSGSLPPGIVYNWVGNSLEISGVPNTPGTFTITFKATDATGVCNGTQTYTINVVNTNISIGDRIWNDLDKDGIQDAGEPGLAGRNVYLLTSDGSSVWQSTVTDSSGYYQMDYITGGSYRIGIDVDPTMILSPANAVGSNDTNDSDFTTTIGTRWVTDVTAISASTVDLDGGLYFGEDYGDLPAPYATTGSLGASHTRHMGLRLGANYDFEAAGQPNATATGDDVAGTPDDEDGVTTFPAFTAGTTSTVSVSVYNNTGATRRLYAFFDWNADGDFVDAGEAITSVLVNNAPSQQTISVSVPVPAGTTSGQKGVRLRLSDQATLTATGASTIGEVEDYFVTVACPAVTVSGPGSFPNGLVGAAYPAQTFTASGGTTPYTWSMSPTIPGMSISSAGVLSGTPTASGTYNVTITATGANNCTGTRAISIIISACPSATALLPGETYTLTANGVVSAFWLVNTGSGAVPISGANGLTYVVSVPGTYTWIGLDALGCVVEGCCPMTFTGSVDYGDLADTTSGTGTGNYQTLLTNGGAVHWTTNATLRLGASVDADSNGQPNATATGDDLAGTTPDDEEAISAMPTFSRGQAFSIPVSYFNSVAILPYLYGFIDWNQDGDFSDAGEALAAVGLGQSALQQSVNLTGTVPANAVLGSTGARFRLTTATGVLATGVALNGEVEDYMITITCPTITVNPATLTNPTQGLAYSATLTATGGSGTYTFAVTSGSLPAGLTLSAAGVISGTATGSGASAFTVTATDANSCTGSRAYTLTPVVTDFGDWSGAGAATTTTTSTRNANLRLGLTVDAEASVTANATATADDTTNTGSADDEDGATSLPATITKGTNSTITLSVFNNTGANAYLHSWIDLNGDGTFNDGVVTTSPGERLEAVRTIPTSATAQTVNITFTVPSWAVVGAQRGVRFRLTNLNTTLPTGASGAGEIEDYVTTIACPTITVNPATLTNPIQGFAYSATITATGGTGAYTYAVTSGSVPAGLTLSSAGVLSGTATGSTAAAFTVTATDTFGCTGSRAYSLTPVITDFGDWNGAGAATTTTTSTRNANLRLGATVDAEASVTANATATADDTTNTGSVDDEDGATTLPATITKGTNSTITLSVFNNTGVSAYLHSWIDLNGDGTFNDGVVTTSPGERLEAVRTIPTNTVAQTVNITFTVPSWAVTGASRGVRFRLTNLSTTLPTGASGSGEIEDYVTTIACPTITVNPATLTNPILNGTYNATVSATGGNGTYTFTVTAGALPTGLTLTGATGVISGTTTSTAAATFTITATDSFGCTGSRAYTVTPVTSDFGDWNGAGAATTTAFATYNANLRLGAAVDMEASVTANAAATTDDTTNTGSADDEDAVTMPASIMQAVSVTLPVSVFNNTGASRYLHAWIDFNGDGTFNDTVVTSGGERLEAVRTVATAAAAATQNITFTVPAAASVGTQRGVRVRVSDSTTTLPTTAGGAGEIEDYVVQIVDGTDLGDFNGFGVASSIFNSTIKMGTNAADAEVSLTANASANADDTTGTDDEDGVTHGTLRAGQAGTITVNVTNTSAAAAFLNVWADWNKNNVADAGEQIATNISIAAATSNFNQVLNVTPPVTTVTGTVPLRARFTAATGATFTGAFSTGEVEDHLITITAPNLDFGDFSGFPQATSVANSTLKLGVNAADAEATITANATANADDTTGTDDEDGVTQSTLRANQAGTITVNVTNTSAAAAYLNVWADWNLNNTVDAGEQIATNTSIAAATSNFNQVLNVTVPATTATGTVPLRARITNTATPGFSNTFPGTTLGEVEDHLLTITAPNRDYGDLADTAAGTAAGNYRTLLSDNGPYHTQNAALGLGALWDAEANGLQSSAADGDDLNTSDDEDAITVALPTLIPGSAASFTVNLRNTTGVAALLNVWIDFNNNGDFEDAGEKVMNGQSIASAATSQLVSFTTPAAAKIATVGVRIRLTQTAGLTSVGDGGVGEVEDYRIGIDCPVITVNPATAPDGNVGFAWTQTFTQTGSPTTPISWSVTSGTVPTGLVLVASTGVLSGTPTTAGTYTFRITATDANNCTGYRDYTVNIRNRDFADWSGFGGSASSDVNSTIKLGALVDNEAGITPNTSANLDDTTGSDDEDGVTQSTLRPGQSGTLTFTVNNSSGAAAYLNAWIDWNNNTTFDAGEQIATNTLVATGTVNGSIPLTVNVPATAPTASIGLRARLTSIQNPVISGLSGIGEVEDHLIAISAPNLDFGDFSGFPQATSVANSTIKLGVNAADVEATITANATANADDTTGTDDEDSVTQSTLRAGQAGTITVNVTNTSAAAAYLNVWADWNKNNTVDAGEQIATNTSIAAATSNSNQVLSVTPPATTATGTVPLRARFTSTVTPGFSNTFPGTTLGEVEDHLITITAPNLDFGDFSGFPQATSVANSTLKLGVNAADAEATITANATANADDTTGIDDEDGVTQSTLRANQAGTITVNVTNTSAAAAYLNVWADWNLNNTVDAGEQIATNTSIAAATSNSNQVLNVTPPAATLAGNVPLRARLTNVTSPGFSNTFPGTTLGEVEDHLIVITSPDRDYGDWNGAGAATTTAFATQNSNLRLGTLFDVEAAVVPNAAATTDDTTGTDDEDSATVPATMMQTVSSSITVSTFNNTGVSAYLHAWIDFNGDGTFNDTVVTSGGERLEAVRTIVTGATASSQTITFTVPSAASVGTQRGVRVRLTNSSTTTPTTAGGTGEIEDYVTQILAATDYGDYNVIPSASSTVISTLRIGAATDPELTNPSNATATGDDTTGVDDEDGTTVPASLTQGAPTSLAVTVTNTSGATAFLSAWIDFNRNGVLTDAGEQIATNVNILNGASGALQTLSFTTPVAATLGTAGVRVRLTSTTGAASSGAFSNGEVEDYTTNIVAPVTDFGDDSDFADAFSTANTNLRLGALVDVEGAATKNVTSTGDDTTGTDDEDAVTFPSITAGQPVVLPVSLFNNTGAGGFLNAWIDFNNNGVLTDAGEQIAVNQAVAAGTNGNVNVNFTVPTNAVTAASSVGARFRITTASGATPTGGFGTGEVEDHQVIILAPLTDFGDHSGYADVSNTANTNLRMGTTVDTEYASTRNASATGDDITGNDDEDGVTIPAMTAGAPVTMPVVVTNTTAALGYLNVWIDYNNNGLFTDAGEQVMTNGGVATATTNSTVNVSFTVPATATTGVNVGVRARITADISPGVSGSGGVGEVEDYLVNIAAPTTDFGDYNLFADASSTQNAAIKLGALTDVEFAATKNATATGDDITGSDDEDSVTMPALTAGAPATIPVLVTNTSASAVFLNAWIDYNNNGILTDAGEQVATNVSVPAGTNNLPQNLSITVPATALSGVNLGVRFRLTSTSGAAATGFVGSGEVEDYVVNIAAPTTDFGDHSSFADASQAANPALRMGAQLDTEFVATKNTSATGDDTTNVDDEDGVTVPAMTAGQTVTIPVTITNSTGANGFLNAWIDYNNNGSLADAGEQIASNITIATGASGAVTNITVNVPTTATTGVPVGLRFRLSAPSGVGPTGANSFAGEIEDYVITIAAPTTDFGDFNLFADASSTQNAAIKLGALTDVEFAATKNAAATGDDITGSDDEDSVTLPALTSGAPATIPVLVTNTSGVAVNLNAWIDYNNNGSLADAGEQIATNVSIPTGTNNIAQNLSITVPATATTGVNLGVRVRLTSTASPGPTGASGNGEVEDYIVNIASPTTDFGDFSSFGSASNARNTNLRLGALVDSEFTATTNATATGDDTTGSDDEDGVTIPAMTAGQTLNLPMTVTNLTGAGAFLNVWIDFNNNGVLTDAGEQIVTNLAVNTGSTNLAITPSITIPATATTGVNIGVRARIVTTSGATATGAMGTAGEVEDYVVNIAAPTTDFGDFQTFADASSTRNANLKLGALTDVEYSATKNISATGDDTTGSDDEDAITSMPAMTAGAPVTLPVIVTNNTGAAGYLNVWIDFNNNGVLTDAGENVVVNQNIATGTTAITQNLSFTVPATAVKLTNLGLRVRFTSTLTPGATGFSGNGEVEDYIVNIANPPLDYGDASVLASASSTANSALRLGAQVDTEFAPTLNATATGDDTTGVDDEDGVTVPAMTAGAPASITVTATNSTASVAYLNAWIDYNNNGSLADAGEQIATNVNVATATANGSFPINITVPATATTGSTVALRFRLTSTITPGSTGTSGTGEVEDYMTTIAVPTTDFGDWVGVADASSLASSNLRMGALADTEYVSTRNTTATGDDATASDDEDGVTLAAGYNLGAASSLTVNTTNITGAAAYLNAWIDFNNNNSFADAGEQIATDTLINTGTNGVNQTVNFTVPAAAIPGLRGARFRLTSTLTPGITGASGTGEVEDHIVTIFCPTITVNPASLPVPTVGVAYNQTATATGGTGPYTWSVSSGALPAWATLNTSTGAITGTPNSTASASFTLRAQDVNTCVGVRAYTLTPLCPAITISPATPAQMYRNNAYSQTFTAAGSTGSYTWTVSAGSLPTGLNLSSAGVLSGIPSVLGSFTFTLRAQDSFGCFGTRAYTVQVRAMSIGNLVWVDSDNDGVVDGGEPGLAGATVQLFQPGIDGLRNTGDDVQVGANFATLAGGAYNFTNLVAGNYFVKVTLPSPYTHTSGTPATTDNNVDNNNDGTQLGGISTPLFSPIVNLAVAAESITDGDTDADSNLTIDFGVSAMIYVGNLVFKDVNDDGAYQSATDTVVSGVTLHIFTTGADPLTATPVATTTSNASGIYQFCVPAGTYFIHVPPSQFASGGPLYNTLPAIGPTDTTVPPIDDNLDQNVLMTVKPIFTGANTGNFTLALGTQPANASGETGTVATSDDLFELNSNLTVDLGFYPLPPPGAPLAQRERNTLMTSPMTPVASEPAPEATTPVTYAAWSQLHEGEDDADLYPNLLEYALDTDPADGRSGSAAFRIVSTDLGHADVLLTRPANGRADIRYELQTSLDGLVWAASDLTPTITIGTDGRQILRYISVDEASIEPRGLLRLKVSLDSNLDGTAEQTAVSPSVMFSRETFAIGQRTFSMPLVKAELFAGNVSLNGDSVTLPKAITLTEGSHYYLEDLVTGLSHEIDEAASTDTEITLEGTTPATLTRVAVREHQRLSQLLPADLFSEGDRVLTFDAAANSFTANPVTEDSTWMRDQLIGKTSGLMIQVREGSREVTQLLTGQVTVKPTPSSASGTRLTGSGSAVEVSPADLGLSEPKGFRSSAEATEASRLRLWKGDSDAEQTGYDQLYLSPTGWQRQDDAASTDLTKEKLLQPFRAFFLLP